MFTAENRASPSPICGHLRHLRFTSTLDVGRSMFDVSPILIPILIPLSACSPFSPHPSLRSPLFRFQLSSLILPPSLRFSGFRFHPSSLILLSALRFSGFRFHPSSFIPLSAFQVSGFIPHPSSFSPLSAFQVSAFIPHPSSSSRSTLDVGRSMFDVSPHPRLTPHRDLHPALRFSGFRFQLSSLILLSALPVPCWTSGAQRWTFFSLVVVVVIGRLRQPRLVPA
jgi:hypothetical protein